MELLAYILMTLLVIAALFIIMVLACAVALGRMHIWLKEKAEVFGDNEGLREELADIRGHVIGQANDSILNRYDGAETD